MQLSENATITSDVILFFDNLFDSFNGKKIQGLSSIISVISNHTNFWKEACNKLKQMQFVEKKAHILIRKNIPKSLNNWVWTINNTQYL